MAYKDLRDFINTLEKNGLIKRIKIEVDPVLEITEITDRMCKSPDGGKALFLRRLKARSTLLLQTSLALLRGWA